MPYCFSHGHLLSLFLLARTQTLKKWRNSLSWKLCCLLLCWRIVLISSQSLGTSCQSHTRARQTSATYVPLSLLFKKIPLVFLLVFYVSYQHSLNIHTGIFSAECSTTLQGRSNTSVQMISFNICTAAALRSVWQGCAKGPGDLTWDSEALF